MLKKQMINKIVTNGDLVVNKLQEQILELKKEKNALLIAHYYQTLDIQEVADHVGDSYRLACLAKEADEDILIFCGVRFMAESAKILSPEKTVLLPAYDAGCPMADMILPEDVIELRRLYPDAAVVCYVNSSAEVKAVSDVCCTSSSAERIVRALPNKQIIFIPDKNLANYVSIQVPEKEIIPFEGYCPTHHKVREEEILAAKRIYPNALVLVHPECREEVLRHADYIGSTAGIIKEAETSDSKTFIIGTEIGVTQRLQAFNPEKRFISVSNRLICPNMKKTTLVDVKNALENNEFRINLDPATMDAARGSLEKMIQI